MQEDGHADQSGTVVDEPPMEISEVAIACMRKRWASVPQLLEEEDPLVNGLDNYQQGTALHWAAYHGHDKTIALLLSHGAEVDAVNFSGLQAVHIAAKRGHIAALSALWQHDGTVVCRGDAHGCSPSHYAAQKGLIHVLEWLYLRGVPMNTPDSHGFSALHWAVHEGKSLTVQQLLQYSVSVDSSDIRQRTPLHWVGLKGQWVLYDSAVRLRADAFGQHVNYTVRDDAGKTASQLAGWFSAPCLCFQLSMVAGWLRCQKRRNLLQARFWCLRNTPRNLCVAIPTILVIAFHCVNVLLVTGVLTTALLPAERITNRHALLTLSQILSQLSSLWHYSEASLSDPGYCSPTRRLDAGQPGPDGHERLVRAAQAELNELLRRRYALMAKQSRDQPEADGRSTDDKPSQVADQESVDAIDAAMQAGKVRLAEVLKQAGAARLDSYPSDYAQLASSRQVELDPAKWGKLACVVCGRMRSQRSKHCRDCGRCVSRFDHHCPWLGNCVGADNLVQFIKFLAWQAAALIFAQLLSYEFLMSFPARPQALQTFWSWNIKIVWVTNAIWTVFVVCMLINQIFLVCNDTTGYEAEQQGQCPCPDSCSAALNNFSRTLLFKDMLESSIEPGDVELGVIKQNQKDLWSASVISTVGKTFEKTLKD